MTDFASESRPTSLIRKAALGAFVLATVATSLPQTAAARPYHHHYRHYASYRHYDNRCHDNRERRGRNGAIIGAVGGGIVANSMARGDRGPGTLLGAGVGALAGHAIGKSSTRC